METLLIILKAIPALKDAVDRFIAFYLQKEYESLQNDIKSGIKKAVDDHDQRDLEKTIGSEHAGLASGVYGSTMHDELPKPNQD